MARYLVLFACTFLLCFGCSSKESTKPIGDATESNENVDSEIIDLALDQNDNTESVASDDRSIDTNRQSEARVDSQRDPNGDTVETQTLSDLANEPELNIDASTIPPRKEFIQRLKKSKDPARIIKMLRAWRQAHPDDAEISMSLFRLLVQTGEQKRQQSDDMRGAAEQFAKAAKLGRDLFDNGTKSYGPRVDPFWLQALYCEARAHAFLGDVDKAMLSLEAMTLKGFSNFGMLESDSFFDALRAKDESFDEKLQELGERQLRQLLANNVSFPFDFTLPQLNGEPLTLSELKGKVVIVDFWGTWCGPCLKELPSFIRLQDEFRDDLVIVGVNMERVPTAQEAQKLIRQVVEAKGVNYPCVIGSRAVTNLVPEFSVFPTTLFVDRTGKVRLKLTGVQPHHRLEAIVKLLISDPSST